MLMIFISNFDGRIPQQPTIIALTSYINSIIMLYQIHNSCLTSLHIDKSSFYVFKSPKYIFYHLFYHRYYSNILSNIVIFNLISSNLITHQM